MTNIQQIEVNLMDNSKVYNVKLISDEIGLPEVIEFDCPDEDSSESLAADLLETIEKNTCGPVEMLEIDYHQS